MKARITQEGMSYGKWCIIEYEEDGKTVRIIRCPFDSKEDALQRASDIAKLRYGETLEVLNEPPKSD